MYELVQAGENTWYIECPAKIGIYHTGEGRVWLIDSGGDKDAARRVCKITGEQGWTIDGVFNTHSNADHIGGNAGLVQRTGCKLVGPGIENAFTRYPILEPSFLFGGYPMKALRGKFLMAAESVPQPVEESALPDGLEPVPLNGHFFGMCGLRTPDDVVFLGDCVFSEVTISRYHIFFIYDVAAFLETLDRVAAMEAALFVPSHAAAAQDIEPLVRLNRAKVQEIAALLLALCKEPRGFEEILRDIFRHYGLTMDMNQYVLVGSTVKSYLSYLCDGGQMEHLIEDNRLLYHTL